MKRKALWISVLLGLTLIVLVVWRYRTISSTGGRPARVAPPVSVAVVQKRTLQFEIEHVGSVESGQTVNIVSKTAGPIIELPLRQGDAVRKGQVLAKIDPSQIQSNVWKKQSDLAAARYTYYEKVSQQALTGTQAESGISIAQADLSAARAGNEKAQAVYAATIVQGQAAVAQAQARLVGAQAVERQAESNYAKSKAKYDRMLGLQRQGFASNADLQDSYQDVLAQYAAVDAQRATVRAAEREVSNARSQDRKDRTSALADIQTTRFTQTSKQATLAEARAATSKNEAYVQQLLAQKSVVQAAEADLRVAQLQLQDTILRSPVDGFVSDRKLDLGAVTSVGSIILTVQAGGEVWVVSSLPQEIYGEIHKGQECVVSIDGIEGKIFPARISAKDSAVDAASRQFNIHVRIDDPQHRVKPGMFARVKMKVGPVEPRLSVSNSALFAKDDTGRTASVYRVDGTKIHLVTVTCGPSDSARTVILSGLAEGETVVVQTLAALKEGQTVVPQDAEADAGRPVPASSPSPVGGGRRRSAR